MQYFLVMDAGTTSIKAGLISLDGKFADIQNEPAEVLMPFPGATEMDMDAVWEVAKKVILKLKDNNEAIWQDVAAMGISAQGDGLWCIDAQGRPVRNAMLWNDTRTVMDYDAINPTVVAMNATALFPGANIAELTWLKKNEPENYAKIAWIFHCKDWFNFKLTGHIGTDASDASTSLMNIYTKQYQEELLDKLNLPEMKGKFAPISTSDEIIGTIYPTVAEELGLRVGIPVIAGCLDVLAIATGCGLMKGGQRGSIVGTTLANYVVMDEETARGCIATNGSILCHTKKDTYIRLMAATAGASAMDWMRKTILDGEGFAETDAALAQIPIGSDGVMSTPYLYGERAPFKLNSASGGFYGIRAHHTKHHLARASFESVAMAMADCYANLPKGDAELYLAGGAAKSPFICQMLCDTMGAVTYRFEEKELGLMGIYRLILDALKVEKDFAADTDKFEPNMANHEKYQQLYQEYCLLKESMMPFWRARASKEDAQ
ncbi:MAG: carbohydrate kinase [Firmicutes bacterium]|nr:carbohydrate kinase [Bacillota bacterium]